MSVDTTTRESEEKFRLPAHARISAIHIRVSDVRAAIDFYADLVGFRVIEKSKTSALLHSEREHISVIRLTQSSGAPSRTPRSAGLFHVAFRYPDRRELSHALRRFLHARYRITGAADHLVSDAIYLSDPDKNGVELYADQPKEAWPREFGEIAMGTEPLDVDALLAVSEGAKWSRSEKGVEIGHVHLQVTDLARSEQFYSRLLGFDVTQRSLDGALFVSAGGYHHHVGMNIWATGRGAPADESSLGMVSFTVSAGSRDAFVALRNRLRHLLNGSANDPSVKTLLVRDPDRIGVEIVQ